MDAEELVAFLNEYFHRMIRIVLDHGGNIDKFQGDGMLVVFGAPYPMADHAEQALNAALEMVREVDRFNRELEASGRAPISVGMGLDTGEVVAGHVGSDDRMEFTLIGVPVNNSAYLSKVRPARVLMSETTRARVPDGFQVAEYEPMVLKGARAPQAIYELAITGEAD
jgi:adenylate cyclase